jgi:C1q domain
MMAINNCCNEVPTVIGSPNQIVSTLSGTQYTLSAATTQISTTQPAFLAYLSTTQSGVTGNGTNYTIEFDTKSFDQNTNYNTSTGIFTAPIAGTYLFMCSLNLSGLMGQASPIVLNVATNNMIVNTTLAQIQPAALITAYGISGSVIIPLAASGTAKMVLTASGFTPSININGSSGIIISYFSGYLLH